MGTNYYLKEDICPTCGAARKTLHVGKSSGGWCFMLHYAPEEGLTSWEAWKERIAASGGTVWNEYGDCIELGDLEDGIYDRSGNVENAERYVKENSFAEIGPRGLLRFKIGAPGCVGHDGEFDLIEGEFS